MESEELLGQFTFALQSSQIGGCIVHHFLKRTWIGATHVVLIRLRMLMIVKLTMDHCSLEELITLQYGNFAALSEWAKQLTQRTRCSKHLAKQTLRWKLYLDELD